MTTMRQQTLPATNHPMTFDALLAFAQRNLADLAASDAARAITPRA
jgi:hypothetical protein